MRSQNQTDLPKPRQTSAGFLAAMIVTLSAVVALFTRPGSPGSSHPTGR